MPRPSSVVARWPQLTTSEPVAASVSASDRADGATAAGAGAATVMVGLAACAPPWLPRPALARPMTSTNRTTPPSAHGHFGAFRGVPGGGSYPRCCGICGNGGYWYPSVAGPGG